MDETDPSSAREHDLEAHPPSDGAQRPVVVVGFDGSDGAQRALAAATRLFGPTNFVIVTVRERGLFRVGSHRHSDAEAINAGGVELARQHGPATGMVVTSRTSGQGIIDAAEELDAQGIVAGFRGHSTARSVLLGSCSYTLAHNGRVPTLIVPDQHPVPPPGEPAATLVAIGEHEHTPTHLLPAIELVRGSQLLVMHVSARRLSADRVHDERGNPLSYVEIRDRVSNLNEEARAQADEVAARAGMWLSAHTTKHVASEGAACVGGAWQGIVERADAGDVDLIIVGSRGLGALDRTTLGSVSNAVVHHTKTPVLIAR